MTTIGVLSLQGDVLEHVRALELAGVKKILRVKTIETLESTDGIILPGGESTVMGRLALYRQKKSVQAESLLDRLASKISDGFPTLATCAGVILLAHEVTDQVLGDINQTTLDCMDVVVTRNVYGRQQESFEASVKLENMDGPAIFPGVFIRAPSIDSYGSETVVLGLLNGSTVAIKQKNAIMTTFHPELTDDRRFHELLLSLC